MRTTDIITKGSKIDTLAGYELVTNYNGSIVYTDSYEIDFNEELQKVGERMLTLEEIGHIMKEVDGCNHKVRYEESEDE